jgi:hypothetical protein
MKLAIADPPYPPIRAAHPRNDSSRARRWYDADYRKTGDAQEGGADHNDSAAEWDDPGRHRALLEQLEATYDGWAIATAHDGLPCYGELPRGARIMIWHRPNGGAGAARIRNCWEPVIIRPHHSRISSRLMGGQVPDLLTCPSPRYGFAGAKPPKWTRWVLDALGYDQDADTVDDLFPGSGSVTSEINRGVLL